MPTVSWFYGISIRMFFNDHAPPHFHAIHDAHEAVVEITTGEVLRGQLPRQATRLVQEWALLHRDELMENWNRARPNDRRPLVRIAGLDEDDG